MVKSKTEINKIVKKALNYLSKKIDIKSAFLFGSYVNGNPTEYSDIDLAVFSKLVSKLSFEEKIKLQTQAKLNSSMDLEIHFFPSSRIKDARKTNFHGHIINTGKKVA